ncbi:MAG: cyclic nucleotide-binding domain-containing protein [Polyangiaceae bacterium]
MRDHNEDCALVDEALGLYVVCDGMGGHAAGEVASDLTSRTVLETIRAAAGLERSGAELSAAESGRLEAVMSSALENANARVRELGAQDAAKKGAGCTCTALLIRDGRGFVGHVGDSRIYLVRHGAVHRLTADHNLVEHAVAQGFSREAALAKFPANPLIRAIGLRDTLLVDTMVFDVLPDDTILLCSDGLHEYLADPAELTAHLAVAPAVSVENMIALANQRGGRDNITAVVIRMHAQAPQAVAEDVRQSRVQEDLTALWHVPLFHHMTYAELLELVEHGESQNVDPGDVVITEGEQSDHIYVIGHGRVRVERGDQVIAELGVGCHFGEMAVLTRRPRTATVRAIEPTRLLAFSRSTIHALFERRPAIGMKFLWILAQVQSVRLDEAQVWDALAHSLADSASIDDLEATTVHRPEAGRDDAADSLAATRNMYPPPLSRHS